MVCCLFIFISSLRLLQLKASSTSQNLILWKSITWMNHGALRLRQWNFATLSSTNISKAFSQEFSSKLIYSTWSSTSIFCNINSCPEFALSNTLLIHQYQWGLGGLRISSRYEVFGSSNMLELWKLGLVLFYFIFLSHFHFLFNLLSILELRLGFNMIQCQKSVTVTKSHNHLSQYKIVKDSRRNNII